MASPTGYKELGQQNIDYQTPLSPYFLCTVEMLSGNFCLNENYLSFLVLGVCSRCYLLSLVPSRSSYPARPFLSVSCCCRSAGLATESICSEHPDLGAILWFACVRSRLASLFLGGLFRFVFIDGGAQRTMVCWLNSVLTIPWASSVISFRGPIQFH